MTDIATEIASHLPYVRRFARAVLGSQERGDVCVRCALERLLGEDEPFARDGVKLTLYRALNVALEEAERVGAERSAGSLDNGTILVRRISDLQPQGRKLLLLTTLEDLSLGQAAAVLQIEPAQAGALLAEAKAALRAQRSTRILIIEDEPVIALDIKATVEQNGHTVVGIASTHREAVALARSSDPGLVLADIQLADRSSGLEAVQEILRQITLPVIFITAYPERLLTGERPEPTFLITKPFDPDTLAVSIAQALATSDKLGD
jgi:CheY-like chemotaxis protein/DNA-directed RNA polymerase specialized sigma24 family protein